MPLASIHLFSLADSKSLPILLEVIKTSQVKPLVTSKPIRWIIRPENIEADALLSPNWDLLLILEDNRASRDLVASLISTSPHKASAGINTNTSKANNPIIKHHWTTLTGIPSRLTKDFLTTTNPALLHPKQSEIPGLTGALENPLVQNSSQDLSLSHDLASWIGTSPNRLPLTGAVSMLNLLAFKDGMKPSYLKYGAAFAETIGAKRGGNAKLVGNIVHKQRSEGATGLKLWEEFALAHYPSLLHFADMLASSDYQEVNQQYRVPALEDTCILCTSELEIENLLQGAGRPVAKL